MMGNRLFVNYDSKSLVRKGMSVRFRPPAPADTQTAEHFRNVSRFSFALFINQIKQINCPG
jgi:hypothetical protein